MNSNKTHLKKRNNNFFFKLNSEEFNFIFIPLAIIFFISLGGFIATSFWSVDLKSAQVFAQGMKYEGVKYWTQFYSALGNTELLVVLFLLIMILIESLYKFKIEKRNNSKWKRNRNSIWWIYGIFLIIWLSINIFQAVHYNTQDKGFGPGFDNEIMDSFKYKQVGKIVAIIIQTTILIWGSLFIRLKLVNKQNFWVQEYWMDAIKAIVFFGLTYLIVAILKWMLGRVYFYNIDFGNLMDDLKIKNPDAWEHYESVGHDKFPWGFGPNHDLGSNEEWPWWQPNGWFIRPKNSPQFALPVNYAFPSGHVNATYCVGAIFYLFIGSNRKRKMNWVTKTLLIIFLIHLLSMNFAVVVMRWHWFSDTTFTNMLAILAYPTVNLIVESIKRKIIINYKNKHNLVN